MIDLGMEIALKDFVRMMYLKEDKADQEKRSDKKNRPGDNTDQPDDSKDDPNDEKGYPDDRLFQIQGVVPAGQLIFPQMHDVNGRGMPVPVEKWLRNKYDCWPRHRTRIVRALHPSGRHRGNIDGTSGVRIQQILCIFRMW